MAAVKQTPLTCSGHTRPVVHLAFSEITEDGYYMISACKDGKPMMRQGDTGDWIGTFEGHKGAVWGVALNGQATRAATGAADFMAKVWDALTGEVLHSFSHHHIVKSVHFSPDGDRLATGSNEKLLRVFDLNNPDAAPQIFKGHGSYIRHVVFINNGKQLLSCSDDKTVRKWDLMSGEEVQKLELSAAVSSIETSCDLLGVTFGNNVSFRDIHSLTEVKEFVMPTQVNSVSMHPEKTVFVCGGEDFKMYKFDYQSGLEIDSFKGHFGPVHCVRFSPDGELYASGSEDGTLRLWQTTVGKTYGLWKCVDCNNAVPTDAGHSPRLDAILAS